MKKFKQTLSGIIALTMIIASLSLMPIVSAEEVATVILDEDCSDAPVGKKADDPNTEDYDYTATFGDWKVVGLGNPAYADMRAPIKAADSTGMTFQHCALDETNNQIHILRKVTQDINEANLTEGVYEISLDVTPTADSWFVMYITDTDDKANLTDWQNPGASYKKNMIANIVNKNSRFEKFDASYRAVYGEDTVPAGIGYLVQVQAHQNIWNSDEYWSAGNIDETKPVSVKAVVNLDRDILSTYFYQAGELVASTINVALNENIKANGLGYIAFANRHGDTKVSNLKVTKLEGYEDKFFGVVERFDNNQLFDGNAIQTPATHRGWSVLAYMTPEVNSAFTDTTYTTIDTETFDSNVLKTDDKNTMQSTRMILNSVRGGALKGKYKISYKMLVESGEAFIEFAHLSYSNRLVQIRFDASDKVVRDFDSGPDGGTACLSGNKGTVTGNYDPAKWCEVEIIVDVPGGTYSYTVKQDGTDIASATGRTLNDYIKQHGFSFIQARGLQTNSADDNWVVHKPLYYLDDIKVEEYGNESSEPEEEIDPAAFKGITENFETAGMLTDGTFSADATAKGWTASDAAGFVKEIASKDGSNVLKISGNQMENARLSFATNGGTALKGVYTITYRMFDEAGEVFGEIGHSSFSANVLQLRLDRAEGKVRHNLGNTAPGSNAHPLYENKGTDSGTFNPAKWCDVKIIINVPENKWSYTVKQDDAIVASATEVELTPNVATNGFNFFQVRGLNGGSDNPIYYLDDLEIREYVEGDEESGTVVPPVVEEEFRNLNETFDSWTTVPGNSSWDSPAASYSLPVLDTVEGTNQALYINPNSESYERGIRYKFNKAVTEGTLNISYDIKVKKATDSAGGQQHVLWPTLDAATDDSDWGSAYPYLNNCKVRINYNLDQDRGDVNTLVPEDISEDIWYTVEMSIRPASSKYDIKITEKETGETYCEYTNKAFENRLGEAQTKVEAFTFRTWAGDSWIDNMIIEHIKQKPVLSNSSIKMYDALGNQTSSITSNVTPALSKIELDFSTAMADVSGITLSGKDAPAVNATINEDEPSKVTLTLDGMLAGGETYTLTVPGTVAAVNGETYGGSGFVLEFATGSVETIADMTGVTVGGTAVTTFAELSAKAGSTAVIKTSAVNASDSAMELTCVVVYYNGSNCLSVKSIDIPDVAVNDVLKTMPEFTIEIPTGATKAKIFLWSTLNDMIPYCEALEF